MSIYELIQDNSIHAIDDMDPVNQDPSLNGEYAPALATKFTIHRKLFNSLFLSPYDIEYVSRYCLDLKIPLRVFSFPRETNTCYEKASLLEGWNPLNIIKALYMESSLDGSLYAAIVPETGCFLNKESIGAKLGLPANIKLTRATHLPNRMSYGTCSPFVQINDLISHGGKIKNIIFDTETLEQKRSSPLLDDFSFGMEHKLSIQLNYYHCYQMLKNMFPETIIDKELLNLSFNERLTRKKGRVIVNYNFKSLNYKTAHFMNSIHGYGDVSVTNDHVDELFVPEIITKKSNFSEN